MGVTITYMYMFWEKSPVVYPHDPGTLTYRIYELSGPAAKDTGPIKVMAHKFINLVIPLKFRFLISQLHSQREFEKLMNQLAGAEPPMRKEQNSQINILVLRSISSIGPMTLTLND